MVRTSLLPRLAGMAVTGLVGVVGIAGIVGIVGVATAGVAAATPTTTPSPVTTSVSVAVSGSVHLPGVALASADLAIPASTVVGVSWAGSAERGTRVTLQVKEHGTWTPAQTVPVASQTGGRTTVAPLVARDATGVRVRISTPSGHAPTDVRLVAVAAAAAPADSAPSAAVPSGSALTRAAVTAPTIITRAQWGADETRHTGTPAYSDTLTVGVLHHTTGWTTYSSVEAFQFVRALYEWYTTPVASGGPGLGDMAYNLLVDRYGRIFEGAAGGVTRPVASAHATGFAKNTVSVAAMGDFEVNPVPAGDAMITSIARVFAWKLQPFGADPNGTARLTAAASGSKFASGQVATVPVIAPVSALATTTSPGQNLIDRLPQIRALAAADMGLPAPSPTFGPLSAPVVSAAYVAPTGATLTTMTNRALTWTARVTSPCLDGQVRVLRGQQTIPGPLTIGWDLRDALGVPVAPGVFRVAISGATIDTAQAAPSITATVRVTPTGTMAGGPCPTVTRTTGSSTARTAIAVGRWAEPGAAAAILVPDAVASDAGYQMIAAPLAHARHLPVLTTGTALAPVATLSELTARGVRNVLIIGPAARVGDSVVRQLAAQGITSWRIWGTDLPATAAAVARTLGASGGRGALFVDPVYHPAESALAAAAAARTGRPLLIIAGKKVPPATAAIIAQRGITSGAVVASPTAAPDALVTSLRATRVWNTSYGSLAFALAGSAATAGERAMLVPYRSIREAALAASAGRPLLSLSTAELPASIHDWLTARPQLTDLGIAVPGTVADDDALGAMARWLDTRPPAPFSLAGAAHRGAAVVVPPSFTINGSGWGHGIGLSQAGAYGQAKEGRTAEQIVTHYFTDTAVTPIDDSMDLAIALLHRVPRAYLRTQPTKAGAVGSVRLVFADGTSVRGTSADTWGFRLRRGLVVVSRSTAGVSTDIATTASVRVIWAGTRAAGSLGKRPTLVNLIGPGDQWTDKQHRYLFGTLDIKPIRGTSSSPAGLMVLNNVRLHDEYLYGLAEVEASWPLAALQSQILASRSYAYAQWKHGLRSSCLCHSDDGGGPYYDQTFLGWIKVDEGPYSANWRAAVDSTAVTPTTGQAITYHGEVITAYYTDSTGGRTRNNEDVWGDAPLAWARGVDDHWSLDPANSRSFAHWRPRVRSQAVVAAAFGLPDVVSVTVVDRQSSQTALRVTATTSTGATATISGVAFKRAMEVPSLWIWDVTPTPSP